MSRTQFSLCGSCGLVGELNPYKVTASNVRQEILSAINRKPQSPRTLAARTSLSETDTLGHLRSMEQAGLVKEIDGRYQPAFAIFTHEDLTQIGPLLKELSTGLVRVAEDNMALVREVYEGGGFLEHGFPFQKLAYILIGAYTFDYGGLDALSEASFLLIAKEMPGGRYVFSGFEGLNLRTRWQWGHAATFGRFTFFSHGELPPEGHRKAFPDLAWAWQGEGRPEEEITHTMQEIGKLLLALYKERLEFKKLTEGTGIEPKRCKTHLTLLQELGYVHREGKTFLSACPVINAATGQHIQAMTKVLQGKFITEILRPSWKRIEAAYQTSSPGRNGIDLREGFNALYHLIFEQASRVLMERGIIPWPKRHPDGVRYAVWMQCDSEK